MSEGSGLGTDESKGSIVEHVTPNGADDVHKVPLFAAQPLPVAAASLDASFAASVSAVDASAVPSERASSAAASVLASLEDAASTDGWLASLADVATSTPAFASGFPVVMTLASAGVRQPLICVVKLNVAPLHQLALIMHPPPPLPSHQPHPVPVTQLPQVA